METAYTLIVCAHVALGLAGLVNLARVEVCARRSRKAYYKAMRTAQAAFAMKGGK
jgi:hypothetical protein